MSSVKHLSNPTPTQIAQRVATIRRAMKDSTAGTLTSRQRATTYDPGVKGPVWVSRITYPNPPENDISEVVRGSISELGDGTERFEVPEVGNLEAQWVGWRTGVDKNSPEAPGSELERYEGLMEEVTSKVTILYIYGGAFMLNGPHSCRSMCSTLSHATGGRCYTVRYRLAPQHPFPAAVLDILHAYLTLVSPPPGSFHEPVAPSSIVLAGDSAGACLALSIIQVLLSFARSRPESPTPIILFHGRPTPLSLPSGVAIASPAADQTMSLPSWTTNAASDIFADQLPAITDSQLPCDVWPSHPPRGHPYAESLTLLHPLASPCTAKSWKGAPPIWIAMGGGERLLDAAKVVARDAARDGCIVEWMEWESMPHLWIQTCKDWWQGAKAVVQWAEACIGMVERGTELKSGGWLFGVDGGEVRVDIEVMTTLTRAQALSHMRRNAEAMKIWTGGKAKGQAAKWQL